MYMSINWFYPEYTRINWEAIKFIPEIIISVKKMSISEIMYPFQYLTQPQKTCFKYKCFKQYAYTR